MSDLLWEGRHLKMVSKEGWECVERKGCHGVVMVVPMIMQEDPALVLVEQFRAPVGKRVIEFPAGLYGDLGVETAVEAVKRELLEETGYAVEGESLYHEGEYAVSPGLTSETLQVFLADVVRVGDGGGVASEGESIKVHVVPMKDVYKFLKSCGDVMVDSKVYLFCVGWASGRVC